MSTPFPLEEQALEERSAPVWDPWQGPAKPGFFSGLTSIGDDPADYLMYGPVKPLTTGLGSAAAKVEGLAADSWHAALEPITELSERLGAPGAQYQRALQHGLESVRQDAQMRVNAMTPDAATTGTAARVLHGLSEGAALVTTGLALGGPAGAAILTGGSQGTSRYDELIAAGVDPATAAKSAGITAIAGAAGAVLPGGVGGNLLARLATGAAGNTAFGMATRYADHTILEAGGYHEMAEQQKVLDGTQLLTDFVLGTAFGGLSHLHAPAEAAKIPQRVRATPEAVDAALAENLALADRRQSPGVPVDPKAANLHQAAIEKALGDLLAGEPVDVHDTGVSGGAFLERDQEMPTEALATVMDTLKEHGFLNEVGDLADLEASLAGRRVAEPPPAPVVRRNTRTPDATQDTALQFLAKHKLGLSSEEAKAQGIDPADMRSAEALVGIKRAFRKGGMSFDQAAETLSEAGYPVTDEQGRYTANKLLEVIDDELRGKPRFSNRNQSEEARVGAFHEHMPTPEETLAAGLPADRQENAALVAKAHELDEGRVESLAKQHENDEPAFMRAIREMVNADSRAKAAAGREGGERASGAGPVDRGIAGEHPAAAERPGSGAEPAGAEHARAGTAEPDVTQALAERPDLQLPEGLAARALAQADADGVHAQDMARGAEAAANCFLRRGG